MAKKILLADDSITIQKVVELTFSEGDYEVVCVGNGSEAIRRADEVVPDVALVDVMMPQRNGYEVCSHIKQDPNLSWIPVLLLTGTFEPFDPRRAEQAGAQGHITKPFESRALVKEVEDLLSKHPRPVQQQPEPEPVPIVPSAPPEPAEVVNAGQFFAPREAEAMPAPPPAPEMPESSPATVRIDSRAFFAQIASAGDVIESAPQAPETTSLGPLDMSEIEAELEPTHPLRVPPPSAPAPEVAQPPAGPPETPAAAAPSAPAVSREEVASLLNARIEEIARPLVQEAAEKVIREIAWEVIPEVVEMMVRRRIRELEEEAGESGAAATH